MSDRILEWVVKGTLYLLGAFSVATWAVVALKAVQAARARRQNRAFAASFGGVGGQRAGGLPTAAELGKFEGPAARLAQAGLRAIEEASSIPTSDRHGGASGAEGDRREYLERSLEEQVQKERRLADAGLAVLASIGTTSPFVGLFGTVWGIIHALKKIGASGSASLEVVAAPIGEALMATGIGIAVAVPAVLAYNIFIRRLKVQHGELETQASALFKLSLRAAPALRAERGLGRQVAGATSATPASSATAAREAV
jgi:biopolymer transport protein ExbB